ncbi:MAG: glycosyltransferase family 39 protein, partial [Planctomycetota bacterium]|nr:glycosyltransferase family 39 protein [Planctomycetota bacterium]
MTRNEKQAPNPGDQSLFPKVILSFLLLALSLQFLGALKQNFVLIRFPYSIEHNEGAVLQLSYDLARGKAIYRPLNDPPYVPGDYPPLFLALNAVAIKIFGLNLWSGRLLSFASALAVAVMIGVWSFRITSSKLWGACAGLSLFLSPLFFNLCSFYRVDVLAVTLSFGGFFVLVHLNSEKGDWVAAVCFLLSLYTKHSMIAGPAAALLFLIREDRARAKNFVLRLVGAGGVLFLLLTITTRQEFFRHLVLYHAMSYDWGSFLRHLIEFGKWSAPFLVCTGALAIRIKDERAFPVLIYAATSLVHLVFLTRAGASMHYLLEPAIACMLATCAGLPLLLGRENNRPGLAPVLGLSAVLAGQFIFVQIIPTIPQFMPDRVKNDHLSLSRREA